MQSTFDDLISSPEKAFLKHFKPSFFSDIEAEGPIMSKIPTSGSKASAISRLAPPGSLTKRPREGSMDLEAGLEAKKVKTERLDIATSNLSKSKSKSMMSINGGTAGRTGSSRGGVTGRPSMAPSRRLAAPPAKTEPASRRQTTTALNDRTNVRSGLTGQRSAVTKTSTNAANKTTSTAGSANSGANKKIAAWDVKGRLAAMESMMAASNTRIASLEQEKTNLQTDVEVKKEVVQEASEEIKTLRKNIEKNEEELDQMSKTLREKENLYRSEKSQLERQLEDESYNKKSLERKLKGVEDELTSKQTEILGLKTSVAELSSSRAGVEAALSGTKTELEANRKMNLEQQAESERKSEEIRDLIRVQEEMMEKLRWGETERRRLHNMVQELKGNIRVFCRMRPLIGEEKVGSGEDIKHVKILSEKNMELMKEEANKGIASGTKNAKYEFEFDRVFGPAAGQSDVYDEISQLVQSALDGYNVCVFAYGQTGSGKTYTMEGGPGIEEDVTQCGVIPRTIRQIFDIKNKLVEKSWSYKLTASFLEIYNEEIRDLLNTDHSLKYEIKMSDSKGSDMHVTNLKVEEVTNEDQIESMIKRARKNRAWAKTLCNERSSRSHSVFMLKIEGLNTKTSETCCGTLNLVDLAGSERVKDSGSEGVRLTEAQAINKSLSNLGNVIMALAQKNSHVPYRNSKLTHLLQNSLGGNSKTLMFVNISPKEEHMNETLNSLRFATKVNNCNIGTASAKKNVK